MRCTNVAVWMVLVHGTEKLVCGPCRTPQMPYKELPQYRRAAGEHQCEMELKEDKGSSSVPVRSRI